jgi:CHAD domain-containing protein
MNRSGPPSFPPRGPRIGPGPADISSGSPGARELRVSRLGSPPPPGLLTQIARIEDDFDARSKKVADAAKRLHSTADNEAIHDLRVALRRLNAAFRMWRELLRPRPAERARRRLRSMRRSLGPVRELEVDVTRLAQLSPTLPPESRVALEGLLLGLHHRLDRRRRRARRNADSRTIERLQSAVARAAEALEARPAGLPEPQLVARVHIDQSREGALLALAEGLATDDDALLHNGRVMLKKWRYALETAAALFEPGVPLEPLRDLQHALGDVHDLAMLRDRLQRRAAKQRRAGLVTHADALNPAIETLRAEHAQSLEEARRLGRPLLDSLPGPTPLTLAGTRPENP